MLKCFIIFATILLISCGQSSRPDPTALNTNEIEKGISSQFYSELIKYQRQYPIPEAAHNELYVFEAAFWKSGRDTFLRLQRSGEGIRVNPDQMLLGIYQDSILAPTVIRDSKQFYSMNFVRRIKSDSVALRKYYPVPGRDYSETYPPVHVYRVIGNQIKFERVDTIWERWE